jgi:hypothetical protein
VYQPPPGASSTTVMVGLMPKKVSVSYGWRAPSRAALAGVRALPAMAAFRARRPHRRQCRAAAAAGQHDRQGRCQGYSLHHMLRYWMGLVLAIAINADHRPSTPDGQADSAPHAAA